MKQQLAIQAKVVPPPTKRELIEAMVRVRIAQLGEEYEVLSRRRAELTKTASMQLIAIAVSQAETAKPICHLGYRVKNNGMPIQKIKNVFVTFKDLKIPKELEKLLCEIDSIPAYFRQPEAHTIRADINARMNKLTPPDERIKTLATVNRPEIEKLLKIALK